MTHTRLRFTLSLFVGLLTAAAPASPQAAPVLSAGQLQGQLDAWYAKAARATKGTWAIAVATQEGQLLWGIQPTRPMIPASTVKVFTTGYARSILGSNAR